MKQSILTVICAVAMAISVNAAGDEAKRDMVLDVLRDFVESWNKHDVKALSDLVTEESNFLAPDGTFTEGKAEITKLLSAAHSQDYKESSVERENANIRFMGPHVAIADADLTLHNMKGHKELKVHVTFVSAWKEGVARHQAVCIRAFQFTPAK